MLGAARYIYINRNIMLRLATPHVNDDVVDKIAYQALNLQFLIKNPGNLPLPQFFRLTKGLQ